MIDVRDIGEVVVNTLTEDGHAGKVYVLTGPESVTCKNCSIGRRALSPNLINVGSSTTIHVFGKTPMQTFVDAMPVAKAAARRAFLTASGKPLFLKAFCAARSRLG